jgi:very-short-patch-repair endonuclease
MFWYRSDLKEKARQLRKHLTESEQVLWNKIRGKQVLGMQFYRQKPIGNYIVDFFCPRAKLVIEVDGSQHLTEGSAKKDRLRDRYLSGKGLDVLRFNSREVFKETDAVMEVIYRTIESKTKT